MYSGTMINIALLYAMGFGGFFIEIRGGLTLVLPFMMAFMGYLAFMFFVFIMVAHGIEGQIV